jgi:hypothetical protein
MALERVLEKKGGLPMLCPSKDFTQLSEDIATF